MAVDYEQAWDLSEGMRSNIKLQNSISFADMPYEAPDIDIYDDKEQYYDPNCNTIHLGSRGIVDIFAPEDDEEFISALDYVRGHEEQHRRSTADVPYTWAVQRGCEVILEQISGMVEKSIRKFRTERDYEYFANTVLPGMGIYISWGMVRQIVASLANSIEDGRIERIRSNRFPGFESKRLYFRGKFWNTQGDKFKAYSRIKNNPAEKLTIIMNQVLSLATCQLYQRGFAKKYTGTPIKDEVDALMPYIGKGVMAPKTRAMAYEVVNICEKLTPYIFETCRMAQEDVDARKMLEDMIRDLIKAMLDNTPEGNNLSEQNEDTDDGSCNSTFPISDLVIELDDEDYDKLVKNSTQSGGGSGIMVKRKHPKPEEQQEEDVETDGGTAGGSGQKEDGKSDGSEQEEAKKPGENKSGESPASSSKGDKGEEGGSASGDGSAGNDSKTDKSSDGSSGKGASGSGSPSDDKSSDGSSGGGTSSDGSSSDEKRADGNGTPDNKSPQDGDAGSSSSNKTSKDADEGEDEGSNPQGDADAGSHAKSKQQKSSGNNSPGKGVFHDDATQAEKDAALDAVLKAMKEAAETNRETTRDVVNGVNAARAHEHKQAKKREVPDKAKPVTEQMKDICDFKELKRAYKLTSSLEPVIAARAKTLKRKNERYFRSLSTPNVSYLDSGSIDPGRIYGLAMGDTEVFRKKGKDRQFDGCAYILLDNSGSMSGIKRKEACRAAAVMEEAFKGLLPIKIVAFDETSQIIHEVIKNWDEITNKNCCWNFCLHGREGNGNEDGYDIKIATRELLARPERKKLLVVMSDGAPGNCQFAHDAVQAARKSGIQVSGIFFEAGALHDYNVERFESIYQTDCFAVELKDLDDCLSKIMQKYTRK